MRISDWSSDVWLFRSHADRRGDFGPLGQARLLSRCVRCHVPFSRIWKGNAMGEFTLPRNSKIQPGKHYPAKDAKQPRTFRIYRWSPDDDKNPRIDTRSEEHTSELQSLMRISYAVFCLKKK